MEPMDVTSRVAYELPDDEMLPITKCVCGKEIDLWHKTLSIYPDNIHPMECCGAKLYWVPALRVMQIKEEDEKEECTRKYMWRGIECVDTDCPVHGDKKGEEDD
jgi:hypothetical protein